LPASSSSLPSSVLALADFAALVFPFVAYYLTL